jgi:hypothetical protein
MAGPTIERAARSIWEGFGRPKPGWERFIPTVQALLQAIREPTEAMIEAGKHEERMHNGEHYGNPPVSEMWTAMIDKALAED